MDKISFTSTFKPCHFSSFGNYISRMDKKCYVKNPWTLNESVLNKNVYTCDILDCTTCIINDGQQALMLHINPECKDALIFSRIENYIKSKISLNNPNLQAVLVGGNRNGVTGIKSYDLFEKFEKFLKESNIPYSALKGTKGDVNIAYSSVSDEFVLTSSARLRPDENGQHTTMSKLRSMFESVKIAEHDSVE